MRIPIFTAARYSVLTASLITVLSACSSGGDDNIGPGASGNGGAPGAGSNVAAGASVPATATSSTAAFINFLNTMPKDDTSEPMNSAAITPPTADNDEPTNV